MSDKTNVLVTGAGGFIGHHLVTHLKTLGYWVRGADAKTPGFSRSDADEFLTLDLRGWERRGPAGARNVPQGGDRKAYRKSRRGVLG